MKSCWLGHINKLFGNKQEAIFVDPTIKCLRINWLRDTATASGFVAEVGPTPLQFVCCTVHMISIQLYLQTLFI
jgi:hypothetical protein